MRQNEGYQKAIDAYEKVNPDVKINLEAVTGNDFTASLKAKMQSDPPTIFSVGGFQDLEDYGDTLLDLSDMDILDHALEGTTDMFTTDEGQSPCRSALHGRIWIRDQQGNV